MAHPATDFDSWEKKLLTKLAKDALTFGSLSELRFLLPLHATIAFVPLATCSVPFRFAILFRVMALDGCKDLLKCWVCTEDSPLRESKFNSCLFLCNHIVFTSPFQLSRQCIVSFEQGLKFSVNLFSFLCVVRWWHPIDVSLNSFYKVSRPSCTILNCWILFMKRPWPCCHL